MRIKGPFFPSFQNAVYDSTKTRKVWNPHQGRAQRLRVLRQKCRHLLTVKDPFVAATGARLVSVVQAQKHLHPDTDIEWNVLMLMSAGMDLAKEQGIEWVAAMNQILDGAAQAQTKVRMRIVEEDTDGSGGTGEPGEIPEGAQVGPWAPPDGPSEGEERLSDVQRDAEGG